MNKKAIQYDNSLKYSGNDPRRVMPVRDVRQTKKSLSRQQDMQERYKPTAKVLIPGLEAAPNKDQSNRNLANKPQWNDNSTAQKNAYADKLEARVIRSDYGKEVTGTTNKAVDLAKQIKALESKKQLEQLKEVVIAEKLAETNAISRKSGLELKGLQEALLKEEKMKKDYDQHINRKYEKMEEQKKLNNFLEEQMRVVRSNRKDMEKVKAQEEAARQKEREQKMMEAAAAEGEASAMWTAQLNQMKEKAEAEEQRLQYMNQYLQKEEEEKMQQSQIQAQKEQNIKPTIQQGQEKEEWWVKDEPDMLSISKNEAKRQYEISKAVKERRQEQLIEKAEYIRVENALNNLESRVQGIEQAGKSASQKAVFSGDLIGRAAAKLIQVHSDEITETIVDELLYEMVALLTTEDAQQKEVCELITRESLVNDYLDEFREMAYEQAEIIQRVKTTAAQKSSHMNFRQTTPMEHQAFSVPQETIQIEKTQIELSLGVMVNILEKKSQFVKSVMRLDHYQKKNMQIFTLITESLLDELLMKVTMDFETANDQYAELLFHHEFK